MVKKVEVPVSETVTEEIPEEPLPETEEGAALPLAALGIGAAVFALAGIAVTVIVVTRRRRKAAREDAESLAALSGQNLIDDDWA